ncbi:MAG: cysteine desulfurase [Bacilli bacterium]|jgi:cysteine desulfurase/selenocysteine lyase|nr:cysteine desulfurase [Bacilli bacterium]
METSNKRLLFPLLVNHPHFIYLDSAATALKPQCVLDKMNEYYQLYGVNIHRGVYQLSYEASLAYEEARKKVADWIHSQEEEIVFTRNATESLNKICLMNAAMLNQDDEILTTEQEHHSSVLPWMHLAGKNQCRLRYLPLNESGEITVEAFKNALTPKTRILAITYASNVMGTITPLSEIIRIAHQNNILVIVDASQIVAHQRINVKELDCDYLAFSGHKMYGPTGIGILYGKSKLLKKLDPIEYGGDMNDDVDLHQVTIKPIPHRFEAGTPAIAEAIGLSEAISFLEEQGMDVIGKKEQTVHQYALNLLSQIDDVIVYNPKAVLPIIAFNIKGVHPHDAASFFDGNQIAIRAGHHCAQLMSKWLHAPHGTLRASLGLFNTKQDIDKLIATIQEVIHFFKGA